MEAYDEDDSIQLPLVSEFGPFEDIKVRHGFIRRVMAVFIAQILGAAGIVVIATHVDCIRDYLRDPDNQGPVMGISFAGFFSYGGFGIYISCNPDVSARFPRNAFLIVGITASLAIMSTILSTTFGIGSFIMGFGILGLGCAGVCIFSFNPKYYIFTWKGSAFCLLWGVLSCATLIPIECSLPPLKYTGGSIAIVVLFVVIFYLHRIMGVATRTGLCPDDYIMVALEVNRCWLCPCFCVERRIGETREEPPYIITIPDEDSYEAQAEVHRRLYAVRSPNTCSRCAMPMQYD